MEITSISDARPVIDAALVRRLVDAQFPQWAELPLKLVDPAGSDHVIYRLGAELSVRLPRHADASGQAEKEFAWLPRLAGELPLAIPVPVALGEPDFGYPWSWSVSRWLAGEAASVELLADSAEAAVELAGFLTALQRFAPAEAAAVSGRRAENGRGRSPRSGDLVAAPLAARDADTRAAIAAVAGVFDAAAMTALWQAALDAPAEDHPPVWVHGDFHTGNLLVEDARLSAVIDFGEFGVGDPACDLTIAFTLMSAASRAVFRAALGVDEAAWTRGRGWALATGLNAHTYYAADNPRIAAQTTRQITEALAG